MYTVYHLLEDGGSVCFVFDPASVHGPKPNLYLQADDKQRIKSLEIYCNMFDAFVSFNLKTDQRSKIANTCEIRLCLVSCARFNLK